MPAGRQIATLYSMAESCVRCCAVWACSLFRCVQVHTLQIVALYTCRISMNMDEYGARGYLLLRNRKDSNYVWRHVSLRMFTRKRCGHADQQLFEASLLVLLLQRPDLKIPPHYLGWLATDDWAGWSAAVHSKAWIAFNPSQNHLALLRHLYLVGIAAMNYSCQKARWSCPSSATISTGWYFECCKLSMLKPSRAPSGIADTDIIRYQNSSNLKSSELRNMRKKKTCEKVVLECLLRKCDALGDCWGRGWGWRWRSNRHCTRSRPQFWHVLTCSDFLT